LTRTEEEETIIINRSDRSTYPERKSVRRSGATPGITRAIPDLIARHRQRLKAIAMRGLTQAVGTVAPLVVLAGQGASAFGLFSVLIAVASLSVVFEWGLPLKVQNEISRGRLVRDYDARWFLFESGFLPHLALNLACAIGLWLLSSQWIGHLFPAEVGQVLTQQDDALLAIFVVSAAIGATYHGRSVVFGLGHIDTGFTIGLLASLVTLALVAEGVYAGTSTAVLAVVVAAAPLLERLFACLYCFRRPGGLARHPSMPPPLAGSAPARSGLSVSLMFLYLQVLALVASNIDSIWAARANSLQSVGEYAFLLKLYGIPLLVVNILSTASMPRLAVESHGGGDGGRRTVLALLRSNVMVTLAAGLVIVFAGSPLYRLIGGSEVDLRPLAAVMLVDTCLLALRGVLTTYVNAAEVLWLNVAGNTAFAAAAIGFKIVLVDSHGIYGLVAANIVAYLLLLLPFHLLALWRGP
jgi:O-antigen/teichoic acid export membrane protein